MLDPYRYFRDEHFVESEVVRFLFRPSLAQLDVVVNYTAPTLGRYFKHLADGGEAREFKVESYEFRLLRFRDVAEVRTILGVNVATKFYPDGTTDEEWLASEKVIATRPVRLVSGL